jgi:hypothetical protein
MESLSPVGSLESFRATLTKNLSNDCWFCLLFRISALSRQSSSTRIAKHRSFIKLKFLQNFCSSCKTLADQVARNPRFYCIRNYKRILFVYKTHNEIDLILVGRFWQSGTFYVRFSAKITLGLTTWILVVELKKEVRNWKKKRGNFTWRNSIIKRQMICTWESLR